MKTQILITIDSLRFDVYESATIPWLHSFNHYKAYSMGVFTLPSHTAMFAGKIPSSLRGPFNYSSRILRVTEGKQPWNLIIPGISTNNKMVRYNKKNNSYYLEGKNIVDGFNNIGFNTIGCGGVDWFDATKSGAYVTAVDDFNHYSFNGYTGGQTSVDFVMKHYARDVHNFIFINFGETHAPFKSTHDDKETLYGIHKHCYSAQENSLAQVEKYIKQLYLALDDFDMYIMSDHGDCFGEDGFWGHMLYHKKVIEVPILKINK